MARKNQAIEIIRFEIERMEFREYHGKIIGMIEMAYRLSRISHEQRAELETELDEKYDTLKW